MVDPTTDTSFHVRLLHLRAALSDALSDNNWWAMPSGEQQVLAERSLELLEELEPVLDSFRGLILHQADLLGYQREIIHSLPDRLARPRRERRYGYALSLLGCLVFAGNLVHGFFVWLVMLCWFYFMPEWAVRIKDRITRH